MFTNQVIRHGRCALALTAAGAALASTSLGAGSFYGVGDLPGAAFGSTVTDISGDGRFVVGHSRTDSSHNNFVGTLFRWSAVGGLEDQQGLTVVGSPILRGPSISRNGSFISGSDDFLTGFRLTVGGEYRPLPNAGLTNDMTPDGSAIVGASRNENGRARAARWRAAANYQPDYIDLDPSATYQAALGTSDDGAALAIYAEANATGSAYLWRNGQAPLLVRSVPFSEGSNEAVPLDISGAGDRIIGLNWQWTLEGGFESLVGRIAPYSIGPDGDRILGGLANRAKIMRADGTVVDVAEALANDYGVNLGSWQLREIVGMSDDGTVWAGNGINPQGFREGWVAVIPEPASLALLSLAGIAIARRRR